MKKLIYTKLFLPESEGSFFVRNQTNRSAPISVFSAKNADSPWMSWPKSSTRANPPSPNTKKVRSRSISKPYTKLRTRFRFTRNSFSIAGQSTPLLPEAAQTRPFSAVSPSFTPTCSMAAATASCAASLMSFPKQKTTAIRS